MNEKNTEDNNAEKSGKTEFPWLRQQVETHLVFGFFAKYMGLGWLIIVAGAIYVFFNFLNSAISFMKLLDTLLTGILLIGMGIYFIKMSRYYQAMIGWIAIKISLGIGAFLCMTLGSLVSLANKQPDALANFLIGLIWLPSMEFIPRITPFQKWVTVRNGSSLRM